MKSIVNPSCQECSGTGESWCGDRHTGQAYRCGECGANTALAWLLVSIGSWTDSKWDTHVRYEFGDEIADRLQRVLRDIPIAELASRKVSEG